MLQPVEQESREKPAEPTDSTEKKDNDIAESLENPASAAQEKLEKNLEKAAEANESEQEIQPTLKINKDTVVDKSELGDENAPSQVSESARP